jgi:hypothetical protein
VLAMTPADAYEESNRDWSGFEFGAGDRVLLLLRVEDMDRSVIITANTRIVAVIEDQSTTPMPILYITYDTPVHVRETRDKIF